MNKTIRRVLVVLLALLFIAAVTLTVVLVVNNSKKDDHTHEYTVQKADSTYLATEATCTEAAKYYYSCSCGESEHDDKHTFVSGNALGHKYGDWKTTKEATETTTGTKERTCSVCGYKETGTIDELNHTHDFGEEKDVKYTSATVDGVLTFTATRTCKKNETHVQTVTSTAKTEKTPDTATCSAGGKITYTVTFSGTWSDSTDKFEKSVDIDVETPKNPTAHKWDEDSDKISYAWKDDTHTVYTATRTCKNNPEHKDTVESVSVQQGTIDEATCTNKKTTSYTVTFEEGSFVPTKSMTVKVEEGELGDHAWIPLTENDYKWNADKSQMTVTRVCSHDENHTETATSTNIDEDKDSYKATCIAGGKIVYTVTFNKSWAYEEGKNSYVVEEETDPDPNNHVWDEEKGIEYTSATVDGILTFTATRTCKKNETHVQTVTSTKITAQTEDTATCISAGSITYTVEFNGNWSDTEENFTHSEDITVETKINPNAHDWDEITFALSGDTKEGAAKRACKREGCGVTETATATKVELTNTTKAATCKATGVGDYKLTFTNADWTKTGGTTDGTYTGEGTITNHAIPKDDNNHEFDTSTWESDTNGHWHPATCDHTTEKGNYAAHSWTADSDGNEKCVCGEYHYFTFTADNASAPTAYTLTTYTGSAATVKTPSAYKGKPVTAIETNAFRNNAATLTSVVISEGITSIGAGAFQNCTNLISVTIPDSVTSIGGTSVFRGCSSLETVVIGNSVSIIGEYAFAQCSSLESITIPDSVNSIGSRTFYGCSSLTSIIIPDSVTSIGGGAFYECTSLTSITIPDGVNSIDNGTFRFCSLLETVVIGSGVTTIGDYAFSDCNALTSVVIGSGVANIGDNAFNGCTSLDKVFYKGTSEQWNKISIKTTGNDALIAKVYYYSETQPTDTANKYWYYENDVATAW